jgi:D-glycero-alpha-D-manno-heptose 1-phosphate guanylyltransferase
MASSYEDIKALLLVGGMGTRLRSVVSSTPKPLAALGTGSFLELLVKQLRHQGIRRFVMCTGYLADQIENQFGDGRNFDVAIEYSREKTPLGTGGAVKLAQPCLSDSQDFLVMNGDSFMEVNFRELIDYHREHESYVTMAIRRVQNANRYGTVHIDSSGRVTAFAEKAADEAPELINAGVYVFKREVLALIPEGPSSLEKDLFPQIIARGVYALEQQGMFIDIGIPEDYQRAQQLCHRLYEAASVKQ